MNDVSSQVESRLATPHQPNQVEGATSAGAGPQQQERNLGDNANLFIKMMQSMQHSQQQLVEEIHQLKADKTKEKGSQHDPNNVAATKETPKVECL